MCISVWLLVSAQFDINISGIGRSQNFYIGTPLIVTWFSYQNLLTYKYQYFIYIMKTCSTVKIHS